ncbi:unnamed protein product [Rhizophagus irregularis]|uniref:Uncharacterized protein n=2 Tax=Rhizophagus irregularis TaxID=588596 RepID=A0A915Z7M1_9GLOM|nr:unnamed protein product [Rhizophagus irregularis]CAB5365506.1 unnamed protein product [Rhizophagus irregularis]
MAGTSNWFEFQWPVDGEFSGFVRGRALPNFGKWNDFSPSAITRIKRLKKNNVKEELEKRSLHYDEKENRPELIAILNENIACETINKIAEVRTAINMNSTVENNNISEMRTKKGKGKKRENEIESENNYFRSGWALKENQEYGKKGGGKHIPEKVLEILKGFFHAGDAHKSEPYSVKEMLEALRKKVEIGELEESDVPKLKTIENWISRYSRQYKQAMAKKSKAWTNNNVKNINNTFV